MRNDKGKGMLGTLVKQGVFGTVDGLGLAIGVMLALRGQDPGVVVAAALANASAELASMSTGEWLSNRGGRWRTIGALTNGICAFIGAMAPVIPYTVIGGMTGAYAGAGTVLVMAAGVAWVMPTDPWWRSWLETGVTMAIVVGTVTLVTLGIH